MIYTTGHTDGDISSWASRTAEGLFAARSRVDRASLLLLEIYPSGLGCPDDEQFGMGGTPLDGTTLLHVAIHFDEQEIFDLLLARGADVNARATVDAAGFDGHTLLFNTVVSCGYANGRQHYAGMARALLKCGALRDLRSCLHKLLDWVEEPHWHEAHDVRAPEWGRPQLPLLAESLTFTYYEVGTRLIRNCSLCAANCPRVPPFISGRT